jgi:tetratricopeptide (TPR) repeat protein
MAMFTGTNKDYRTSQHHQAEMRRQAEQYRLGEEAHPDSRTSPGTKKWIVRAVLIGLAALAIVVGYGQVHAQDAWDTGESELFPEAMLAYRLGNYYLVTGDCERAVEKLSEAIDLMPAEAFTALPQYSVMYWTLGQAQEQAEMQAEALASYRQFLTLAGEKAAPWTAEKVQQLQAELDTAMLVDVVW